MTTVRGKAAGVDSELDRYMQETTDVVTDNGLQFWQKREHPYPLLAPLAEDFISSPASQVYVERVFSVCGDFRSRKRNRAKKCLKRRVFLKMNRKLVSAKPWTDMWTCACVHLASHNWCFWLFDCLWTYHCRWSWLTFSTIPITACVTLTVTGKIIKSNCNSNFNWKTITGITLHLRRLSCWFIHLALYAVNHAHIHTVAIQQCTASVYHRHTLVSRLSLSRIPD